MGAMMNMEPVRVLLVEDNPGDADITRETLEAGKLLVDITVVVDGAEALDYLLRKGRYENVSAPDLVVLDLNIPKINGRQVLEEMQRQPTLRTIPTVIMTSSSAEKDIVTSYELGANCYLIKPLDLEAFQTIVQSVNVFSV